MKPNFFIVGAQKSGTTAISEYLKTHPNVSFSSPKEPHFFSPEFVGVCPVKDINEYLRLFPHHDRNIIAVGEASTGYLQSATALENIFDFNHDAKIIVMLRNPIQLVKSLHSHLLFYGHEDEKSFEKAWHLQEERKRHKFLPKDPSLHYSLQYSNVMRLGTQLNHVLSIFPRRQVKVIIFDDFVNNPKNTYHEILSFLDLPIDSRNEFPKLNQAKSLRFPIAICAIRKILPWRVRNFYRCRISSAIFRMMFSNKAKNYQTPDTLYQEMRAIVEPEVKILSKLLNRNLDGWLR